MSQEIYHIPKTPTAFFHFQGNAIDLCTANATAWDIPADTLTNIAALQATYVAAYNVVANPATRSPSATAARDAAQEILSAALTELYNTSLVNNAAIDVDYKIALHIHNTGSGTNKPAPAPATSPVIQLISEGISQLFVVYADSATPNKHHKPANVAFAELWYKVGEPAPALPADCPERFNVTRSHEPIQFEPAQRGQACYGFARWVNKNGKTGPWGSVFTEQVP